ncbi:MAG: DUF1573 domain-containing protein [Candidatus Azobacteroides sp.]|nr:DUF1573 domain-containing protein [Candidatus Azobacteroides sp.]
MKRIYLLLTSFVLFCGGVGAQNEKISINETDHNFGVIGEKDGNAAFDFILTNNSNESFVITKATASCGCTTPIWTKEPIEPRKTGKIFVSYNPVNRPGSFTKSITVYTSQSPTPIRLTIRGEVVQGKIKINPEEAYPVAMGNYLLKSKELNFGRVTWKEAKTIRLEVFNNSDQPITQRILKLPKYLSVTFNPAVIPAKKAGVIDVNFNAQDGDSYGNLSGDITLLINETRQSFPYSATVLEDFSQWTSAKKADAGKINVSTSEINFGNFSSGTGRTLKISNSGKSVLNIRAIQSSDPSITVSKTRFSINPGEITEIKVNADNKKIPSKLSSTLSIMTDDPDMPIYEISVLANK